IERGISLLKPRGIFGYIVANKWMRSNYGFSLRELLLTQNIERIVDFGDMPVFQGATTYPCILIIKNEPSSGKFLSTEIDSLEFGSLHDYVESNSVVINQ